MSDPPLDTPMHRATVLQMQVDQLDQVLATLRERRMVNVRKLEALAKVKADDSILVVFIKLEKAIERAGRALAKAQVAEAAAEVALHKARLLAIECSTQ